MVVSEPIVAVLATFINPVLKGLTHQGVDHRTDIVPRHLTDLPQDWQRVNDLSEGEAKVQYIVERETLVLGDGDDPDINAVDGLENAVEKRQYIPTFLVPAARSLQCQIVTVE